MIMPSTYAHYRMGQEVLARLPVNIRSRIISEIDLFNMGLYGPDLLFYYRPLEINHINRRGYAMHRRAGIEFASHAARVLRSHYFADSYFAYACGFICHFALDRQCHRYILRRAEATHVPHAEIEMGYDRALLLHDGFEPAADKLMEHIRPDHRTAKVIASFFPDVKPGHVLKAMRSAKLCNKLLLAPVRVKRRIVNAVLELTGNSRYMQRSMISMKKDPILRSGSKAMSRCYRAAVRDSVTLITDFRECACGRKKWHRFYRYAFSSRLPGKDSIP